jgi:hypothetical protein
VIAPARYLNGRLLIPVRLFGFDVPARPRGELVGTSNPPHQAAAATAPREAHAKPLPPHAFGAIMKGR